MLTVKERLIKMRLVQVLKGRDKHHFVSVFFGDDERDLIVVRNGKRLNECFGIRLHENDMVMLRHYLSDGTFLIYGGRVQTALLQFLLQGKRKWRQLVRFYR